MRCMRGDLQRVTKLLLTAQTTLLADTPGCSMGQRNVALVAQSPGPSEMYMEA